jgi:SAM-dependent methyltransferase
MCARAMRLPGGPETRRLAFAPDAGEKSMPASERQARAGAGAAARPYLLAKKLASLLLDRKLKAQVAALRALGIIDFPVPPYRQLLGIGAHGLRHYYESGINCYLPIAVAALNAGLDLNGGIRILDFGCGVARQLQHFTRHFRAPSYHACDVNEPAIGFVKRHWPQVAAFRSPFRPPLPIENGFFDMIYSVSVFTHLAPDDQQAWLQELARVTRPAGHCFLTTAGFTALRQMRRAGLPEDLEARRELLAAGGIIFRAYAERRPQNADGRAVACGSGDSGIDGSYGTTALAPDYIERNWPKFGFAVEAILEGIIDYRQDLVVLRRT